MEFQGRVKFWYVSLYESGHKYNARRRRNGAICSDATEVEQDRATCTQRFPILTKNAGNALATLLELPVYTGGDDYLIFGDSQAGLPPATEFTEFTLSHPARRTGRGNGGGRQSRVGSFELFLFVPRSCCAPA
ncbi:hypothetical protein EVAR_32608_1 [Eumeta japonica]|uniref:Uncharacterized protein n=1 Tax=Eumeta variegata TaxID=151549 RepID=A0A4C1WH08_EUMVA|nr:hypothetical protein EVAR_32608_1 [Eumeta japonica]